MNRADLRTRILRAADMYGSAFVSPSELNDMIDDSLRGLHSLLVRVYGESAFAKFEWLNVTQTPGGPPGQSVDNSVAWPKVVAGFYSSSTYQEVAPVPYNPITPDTGAPSGFILPDNFQRLLRVDFCPGRVQKELVSGGGIGPDPIQTFTEVYRFTSGSPNATMRPMSIIDLAGQAINATPGDWMHCEPCYRIVHGPHRYLSGPPGSPPDFVFEIVISPNPAIEFLPRPTSDFAVRVCYVPKASLPTNDTADIAYERLDYVVAECAALCLEKERSDSAIQRAKLANVIREISENESTLDAANPPMVTMHGSQFSRGRGLGFRDS